ncbi:hypothetical protein [Kineococcus indalonis]|uniref:hypothetical protein n=1 Tax=Kineococcus indalonis TaxID=2696566 RepID=UPI001412AC9B|nr:hypothetical protein [Kineococcus indalonis]NAZ86893.1 hypothetical protein [Kineococcus indalonis]
MVGEDGRRDGARHWGGSGRYVEGERVFAPPAGVFDADWVAGIVLDRHGAAAGERVELARAAQRAWEARRGGAGDDAVLAELVATGLRPWPAAAVLRAADDYAAAYGTGA